MRVSELRTKTPAELIAELTAMRREWFNLRVQKSMKESPRLHSFRQIRRNIARIKTILNEKKREEQTV